MDDLCALTMHNTLILLRGLPGAGKTTLAELLSEGGRYPLYSIDDYFTTPEGLYRFEHDKNHLAYRRCEELTAEAMQRSEPRILVHNTFVYDWEMEPYFRLALQHHYRMHVVTVENHHGGSNVHQVSDEQIRKMAEKYRVKLY